MVTLEHTLRMLKIALLDDGVISLGETSILLRAIRPFVANGSGDACELRDILMRVRQDGIITPEESRQVAHLLDKITKGSIQLEQYIFQVPDYPAVGQTFVDMSRFLDTPWLFNTILHQFDEKLGDVRFDLVASPSPRGTPFGAAIAARRHCGFVPISDSVNLPREALSEPCESAFGHRIMTMHEDAVMRGERVLIVDDLLATGATAAAIARLVNRAGGQTVKMLFPVELEHLKAREQALHGFDVSTLVKLRAR